MKTLIKFAVFSLFLFSLIYFGGNYFLKKLALRIVSELKPRLEHMGVIIEKFDYSGIRLNSYNSCAVRGVDLDFHLNKKMYGKESFYAQFEAKSITIRFADLDNPSLFFTLKDFSLFIEPDEQSAKKPFGKLENGYLRSRIPLYLKDPEESAREMLAEVKTLFKENNTPIDLEMDVDVLLGIDEKEVQVGLLTHREQAITHLKFNVADIIQAAKEFELDLTQEEAEIISNYPGKVPELIKISRNAKRLSEKEKEDDKSFPEDAFRHIYWSYHLTREFGADLAKEITDAHENAPGNTQNERLMDYHNNCMGRSYATENLTLNELKERVRHSSEIMRTPADVK